MKTLGLFFLTVVITSFLYSQEKEISPSQLEEMYFVTVEDLPEPIGGMAAIQANVIYPEIARRAGIQGTVYVEVFIDEKGNVVKTGVKKGIGAGCDEAAQRAVTQVKFKPGKQQGQFVKVRLVVPIRFTIRDISEGYLFNLEQGAMSEIELRQLMELLQVRIERFSYEVPFRHQLRHTLEEYEDSQQTSRKFAGGSSTRQGGKATFSVLVHNLEDNKVMFQFLGPRGSSSSGNLTLKSFGATKVAGLPNVRLKENVKTPVFVYAMNPRSLDHPPAEGTLDYYLAKYKYVIVLFLELRKNE